MKKAFALLFLGISSLAVAQVPPTEVDGLSVYIVPGVVNAAGRNNTRFVSDLALTNPGTSSASVILSFVPGASLEDKEISLGRGKSIVWRNVLQQIWGGVEASGAVIIVSDKPLLGRARTYNTASTGTFGVALPVVPMGGLLEAGDRADCLWISQSPDGAKDFRTNIAVAFPNASGGKASVTLFDPNGSPVGAWTFSSDSAGLQQVSVGSIAGPLPVGRAEIRVRAGRAVAYASVVDNVTGDSSLFPFEPLPAGVQDLLVNGVARAAGKNNTFFRTDARLYNPGSEDAALTVSFLPAGEENLNPASATIPVPAGRILDVVDVLGSWFSASAPSSGALRVQSQSAVAVLCRTSNVDPSGAKPGTFGAQQKPVPLMSFLSSADSGALISGLRQNASYRTNVGFAAGPEGATYQLALKSSAGSALASVSRSLGPFGWEQPGIDKVFNSVPDDAQLFVKVTQGSVDVFDSSVDNGSGDSVVTPAQALPVEIPSSATIGPEGGSVRSDDRRLTVRIPAGALASPSRITLQSVPNGTPNSVGPGYTLSAGGATFAKPPIANLRYGATDLAGTDAGHFLLVFQSASSLYAYPEAGCDTAARTCWSLLAGAPAGAYSKTGERTTGALTSDSGGYLSAFYDFRITPGFSATLAGGIVNFKLAMFVRDPEGDVHPLTLLPGSRVVWDLDPTFTTDGELRPRDLAADYVAPVAVDCPKLVRVRFFYFPAGFDRPRTAGNAWVTLLPKQWDLFAQVAVVAGFCRSSQDVPDFEVTTNRIKHTLTLEEDPGGKILRFKAVAGTQVVSAGSFRHVAFCPSPHCADLWEEEPGTELTIQGAVENYGGWNVFEQKFFLRNWGLILGNAEPFKWGKFCSDFSNGHYQQLLPNFAVVDVFDIDFRFDRLDPEDSSCLATRLVRYDEWRSWIKVPITKKDPYYDTGLSVSLHPR